MAADLGQLTIEAHRVAHRIRENAVGYGVVLVPFFTLRDPWTQARIWRRSRSAARVQQQLARMDDLGMAWLASVLEEVGPQPDGVHETSSAWGTNAVPGLSWHQWAEAVDYFVQNSDGSANWDGTSYGYRVLAEQAARMGVQSGFFWKQMDPAHVQMRRERVREVYSWREIDDKMRERWQEA